MKKILVISNLYPSKEDPTYGTFVKNFVYGLEKMEKTANVDLCVIRGRTNFKFIKLLKYLVFYIKSVFLLLSKNYDLVYVHYITHSSVGLRLVSFFKEIPIAFNIHGDDLLTKSRFADFILEFMKPLLFKSKLIVVPSNYFKMVLLDKFPCLDSSNIFVSASGGVKHTFYTLKKISNDQTKLFRLGYVSRVDYGKGWDSLIKAVGRLQHEGYNVSLDIVGNGFMIDKMNFLINDIDVSNVHYLGPIPYDKLPQKYKSFDLFIFPTELHESLGLVGLEAMASGTVVVGSNIGGLKDYIIDGYNGFLFEAQNVTELVSKIKKYISLPIDFKSNMSKNAFMTAMEYKDDVVSNKLMKKLEETFFL